MGYPNAASNHDARRHFRVDSASSLNTQSSTAHHVDCATWTKRLRRGSGGAALVICAARGEGRPSEVSGLIPLGFRPFWLEFLDSHA